MELYLHIPFCKRKCLYCDFNSYANCSRELIFGYLTALNRELELAGKEFLSSEKPLELTSVFIGGGTPSLLEKEELESVVKAVKNNFDFAGDFEFTIEANPESLTEEKLALYRSLGINRLSVGVQSLYDDNLQAIGRIHDAKTALEKIKLARRYFDNLSCDLMIGLPFDTKERVQEEVATLANIVDHISVYQLILEENTPLENLVKNGKIVLPNDDETIDLFDVALNVLRDLGFCRYEVSNFAKDGKYSRHNFGYWMRDEYLGIGAGAASFLKRKNPFGEQVRISSFAPIEKYIESVEGAKDYYSVKRESVQSLDESAVRDEEIMLGLRTSYGVKKSIVGEDILAKYAEYFVFNGDRVHLTDDGLAIMNTILVDAMSFED